MTADILIVAPVLARPQNAEPLVDSLYRSKPIQHWRLVFVCTPGDTQQIEACQELSVFDEVETLIMDWEPGPGDYARKIQAGYDTGTEPLVLLGADDLKFHERWDTTAAQVARDYDVGVIGTNDLGNAQVIKGVHATHPLVTRGYIDTYGGTFDNDPGRVYSPAYSHQYVDSELVSLARLRGCYAHCHESVVEHLHPLWRKGQMDGTYEKALADGDVDRRVFEARRRAWIANQSTVTI